MPEYRRCRLPGDGAVHRISLTTASPFVEAVTTCGRRSDRYEPVDEPVDCEKCRVRLFLADVRQTLTRRGIAGPAPGLIGLVIGDDLRDALLRSGDWRDRAGGADAGLIFGVPTTAEPLFRGRWRMVDADGYTVASGEL